VGQTGAEQDAADGLVSGAVSADDDLGAAGQEIAFPVRAALLCLVDVIGDRLGGVQGEGFGERHVQVVAVGRAAVVGAQLGVGVHVNVPRYLRMNVPHW
jgi:hypothetical protein